MLRTRRDLVRAVGALSLRSKIVVILSTVVLMYAALDQVIQKLVVLRSFEALEAADAEKDLRRVVQALQNEIDHLDVRCDDWATWDDTYQFVKKHNSDYIASNLGLEAFRKNKLDLLYIVDLDGRVVYGRIVDHLSGKDAKMRDFPPDRLPLEHPLLSVQYNGGHSPQAGIFMTERGPMLVSSKSILDSQKHGPTRGAVIMGRLLSDELVDLLVTQTGVEFVVWPMKDGALPESESQFLHEILASDGPIVRPTGSEHIQAYTTFADIGNAPAILLRATLGRGITQQGRTSVRYALLSTIAAGLLIMLVMLKLLQRTVLEPIALLTEHAVEIGKSEDTTKKLNFQRQDEIGILSRELDGMMDKLAQSRAALVKAARAAGMSEIATGVLHNVGNVLNSVNVSATLVADKARNSGVNDLKEVMQAVKESADDLSAFIANDPRGKHLYPLLTSLTEQLAVEQLAIVGEVKTLTEGIDHIKELIQSQQSYAGRPGVLEAISIAEQIESALSMTGQTVGGGPIEVVRDYDELAPCAIDRHRLMEILVNLIQNARQALQSPDVAARRLTLRLKRSGDDRVRIEVEDSGVGIAPQNLSRVFTHGFTTKKTGHGFGLHASANAATEMCGSLAVKSEGPGRGATFILDLSIQVPQRAGASA